MENGAWVARGIVRRDIVSVCWLVWRCSYPWVIFFWLVGWFIVVKVWQRCWLNRFKSRNQFWLIYCRRDVFYRLIRRLVIAIGRWSILIINTIVLIWTIGVSIVGRTRIMILIVVLIIRFMITWIITLAVIWRRAISVRIWRFIRSIV